MARLFEERERAAENKYAHDEELIFLARRRGIQATAHWAAESMGLDADASAAYETGKVDAFLAGASEIQLVETIQTDLERAGKPTMVDHVGTQLAHAVAEAGLALRGRPEQAGTSHGESPREEWSRHHPKPESPWGWGLSR